MEISEKSNYLRQVVRGSLPYLPVYNAHFFPLKSTFKFTMRIIHGFHCLAKKTKEDKSFVVIGV